MQWKIKKQSQVHHLHIFLAESTNINVDNFYQDYEVISWF